MSINLELNWAGGMKGTGHIKGDDFSADVAIPAALGGKGTGTNPKELFVASTAACFLATLAAISEGKKLPVESLSVDTVGDEGKDTFTIRHTAHVTLQNGSDADAVAKAIEIVAAADKMCAVGNIARKAGVEIEATADIK
ncbi:OsmC family protein [Gallaecimonas mangrovi]|uniref:OsmC family protein n=1 Tax=Gallaecimonas mangrovi TaxID=2291597 RepID=UPI000E207FA5|nr:OsmC family protein [Gallaecimonas mangrovi]